MIKPKTSDFLGNELDKAKLEIASYWKDKYEKTQKALDVAVDALKIAKNCCYDYSIESLAEDTLDKITALEQKDK